MKQSQTSLKRFQRPNKEKKNKKTWLQHWQMKYNPRGKQDMLNRSIGHQRDTRCGRGRANMRILPIASSKASRSSLLVTGLHSCRYIDNLYMPSAGWVGKIRSIVNLFLMFQSVQHKAAHQVHMIHFDWPTSTHN